MLNHLAHCAAVNGQNITHGASAPSADIADGPSNGVSRQTGGRTAHTTFDTVDGRMGWHGSRQRHIGRRRAACVGKAHCYRHLITGHRPIWCGDRQVTQGR